MIDLHSHILPQMDDGSRSTEESLQMLTALAAQGVTDVAATPHFYASENGPDRFLARRARSWQQLRPHLTASLPRVHLGAEVLFFEGIAAFDGLPRLCLSGADTLLLEMPFRPWSQRMLDELLELADRPDVTVLLAHMERYLPYVAEPDWRRMARSGLYIQSNADFFCGFSTRRRLCACCRRAGYTCWARTATIWSGARPAWTKRCASSPGPLAMTRCSVWRSRPAAC